jgi:hypothetical protein
MIERDAPGPNRHTIRSSSGPRGADRPTGLGPGSVGTLPLMVARGRARELLLLCTSWSRSAIRIEGTCA